jgi:hypothetical protein
MPNVLGLFLSSKRAVSVGLVVGVLAGAASAAAAAVANSAVGYTPEMDANVKGLIGI